MDKKNAKKVQRKVRCPRCHQESLWAENPHRPFCSKECKDRDLGSWATESYKIPVKNEEGE